MIRDNAFMNGLILRSIVLAILALNLAACSLPFPFLESGGEVMLGYAYKNPSEGKFRRIVPGLDIRIDNFAGINLGWHDLRFLEPVAHDATASTPDRSSGMSFAFPLGLSWTGADATRHFLGFVYWSIPEQLSKQTLVHQIYAGLNVPLNHWTQGFALGIGSATYLSIDAETDGIYSLYYSSRNFSDSKYTYYPKGGNEQ
jgi:hypothetical protein